MAPPTAIKVEKNCSFYVVNNDNNNNNNSLLFRPCWRGRCRAPCRSSAGQTVGASRCAQGAGRDRTHGCLPSQVSTRHTECRTVGVIEVGEDAHEELTVHAVGDAAVSGNR